jgi:tRNA (uracil-5-)-methyltransferase
LGNLPYEEQLLIKQKEVEDVIEEFKKELKKANEGETKLDIEIRPIIPSPEHIGYRNKVEFSVGRDAAGEIVVGNRSGSYVSGNLEVESAENLVIASDRMKRVAKLFGEFIKASKLEPFSAENNQGYWKQITVRLNNDELMLIVGVNPQNLTSEELDELQKEIVVFFTEKEGKELDVKSLYYEDFGQRKPGQRCNIIKHLYGETHIHDYLNGLKFRISPSSFFQVNTKGAEKLYQEIINLAGATKDSVVLDVCCGTGTIGITMAKHCKQVYGMEVIQQAIEDADINCKENGIENAKFQVGSAEDFIYPMVKEANLGKDDDVIAVVDPPRSGLGIKGIMQLRNTQKIKRIVYVSCSPKQAMRNFVDLTKKSSKFLKGPPFVPKIAVSVDMFPNTSHWELIILFER